MSSINQYKHELLGFIKCESDYDLMHNNPLRKIAIYKLKENVPDEEQHFDGRINDIVLGGGSGEVPAFRITYPDAFKFFTQKDFNDFNMHDELFKSFWTPTLSFKLCNGFLKSGWEPNEKIEFWLAEQICKLLIINFSEYSNFGSHELSVRLEFEKVYNGLN